MPKSPQDEVVDDYYSNISKQKKDSKKSSDSKPKLKIVSKKISPDASEEVLNETEKIQTPKVTKVKKVEIVNTIPDFVEKKEIPKKEEKSAETGNVSKKIENTHSSKTLETGNKPEKTFDKKEFNSDRKFSNNSNFSNSGNSSSGNNGNKSFHRPNSGNYGNGQNSSGQKSFGNSSGNYKKPNSENSSNSNSGNQNSGNYKKTNYNGNSSSGNFSNSGNSSSGNNGNKSFHRPNSGNSQNSGNKPFFKKDNNSGNSSSGNFSKPSFEKKDFSPSNSSSDFSADKTFKGGKKTFKKDDKKGGKKFYEKDSEKENTKEFSRSNKINKKAKVEKDLDSSTQNLVAKTGETIVVAEVLTIKELSEKIGIPLSKLVAEFMKNGMLVNINSKIDFETASIISDAFEIKLQKDDSSGFDANDILLGDIGALLKDDDTANMQERPPVISIMGHVDHGKTSLLDYIRNAKVAAGEAGGITQSIGAYQVNHNGKKITFLDTPGHEAFTVMRARGAKATDIAILVVAADEGVKPQTIESISHAKQAGIPIVVAINKMDKEGANPDHLKGQLAEHDLVAEEWGGTVPMVPVSAKTGFGIDSLLEIILLVAEMQEFKANYSRHGVATVIESHLDTKLGPVATVLINAGTLRVGESVVCKTAHGKIKSIKDFLGNNVKDAAPGDPVRVIGLDKVAEGGDILQVVSDINVARSKALEYQTILASKKSASKSSLEVIMSKIKTGNLKKLNLVVKADTNGSLEAIKGALHKISNENVVINIIHSGVGNITEGDALMAGNDGLLIAFRTDIGVNAKSIIEEGKFELISSDIIYHITEKLEKIALGMLDPKEVEVNLGRAKVGGIFYDSKEFMILGLQFGAGVTIEKKAKIRVIRGDRVVGKGEVASLKSGVEEVNKIEGPNECGIKFVGNTKPEMGDILELYKIIIEK